MHFILMQLYLLTKLNDIIECQFSFSEILNVVQIASNKTLFILDLYSLPFQQHYIFSEEILFS